MPKLPPQSAVTEPRLQHRFARLTALNVLSNLTVPLASLIDTALLGHLADVRFLAGVALASILFEYLYWSFGFLRMGTTGTTAQAWGRGDTRELFLTLYRSLVIALGLALLILLLQVPIRDLGFAVLSGSGGVESAGRAYFEARIWAAPATLANFVLMGWFLGREESSAVLVMTILANVSNVILDYILIIKMGLAAFGAGLGTSISQYLALACGLLILWSRPGRIAWHWGEVAQRAQLRSLFVLNRDILIRTVALVTSFALFTNFSAILGTVTLAANAVLLRLVNLVAYFVDGAAFAAESLGGILKGAQDNKKFHYLKRLSLWTGLALTAFWLVLFLGASDRLLRLITTHEETRSVALRYLPWIAPVLLIGSLAYIYDGLFLGLTAGRALRNSMLLSTFLVFVPLAILGFRLRHNHILWASLVGFMMARWLTLWYASHRVFPPKEKEPARDE